MGDGKKKVAIDSKKNGANVCDMWRYGDSKLVTYTAPAYHFAFIKTTRRTLC